MKDDQIMATWIQYPKPKEDKMATKVIYISANERGAGSIIASMGFMQLLQSRTNKVSFFRPIITSQQSDYDIEFMIDYFKLEQSFEQSYGVAKDMYQQYILEGKLTQLLELIMQKIDVLKGQNEFVLVEGIAKSEIASNVAFDTNHELAKNLNAYVVSLISAKAKSMQNIIQEIAIETEALHRCGLHTLYTIVNRVPQALLHPLKGQLDHDSVVLFEEIKSLGAMSLQEILVATQGQIVFATPLDLQKTISTKIIAAMQIEHYLERVSENCLVIVPTDRVDIIMATVLALHSRGYPKVAGLILTGNLELAASVHRLLQELAIAKLPMIATPYDTYQTAMMIDAIEAKISPQSTSKIALAMGLFYDDMSADRLFDKLDSNDKSSIMTPAMFEYMLMEKARKNKKTIVLPESEDERILRAAEIILKQKVANIILLGDAKLIEERAKMLGLEVSDALILDPKDEVMQAKFTQEFYEMRKHKGLQFAIAKDAMVDISYFATMLVHLGYADGMVSGAVHTTAQTIRPALQIIKTKPEVSIVSSLFFMCLDTKVLVYADCAVNQNPTAKELCEIAYSSASTAKMFGISPKVAMLSYSTGSSGEGEDVQKVQMATKMVKESYSALEIEGPIQYDAATNIDVAKIKLPNSKVAGCANVLIFPDLNTGNNTYKAVQRSANAVAIGPILQGLKKPINDLSRGALVSDIVSTIVITAIQAGESSCEF